MITMRNKIIKFIISFIIYMLPFGVVVIFISAIKELRRFIVNRNNEDNFREM